MAEDPDPDAFVLLEKAPNAAIAGLWASMLEAAGIQAYVPGTYLADEWAATQRVIGNVGTDVFVPRSRLEEARALIAREEPARDDEDTEGEAEATLQEGTEAPTGPRERRAIVLEVLAVSAVVILPFYVSALSGLIARNFIPWRWRWNVADSIQDILYSIPQIVLLRWVISRSGDPPSAFGWRRLRPVRDLLAGAMVFALSIIGLALFVYVATAAVGPADSGLPPFVRGARRVPETSPANVLEWVLLLAAFTAAAFLEELSIRGWLMTRLRTLLGSRLKAATISSLAWAGYHVYQGLIPMVLVFLNGLILAWAFSFLKRLWPLVIAHAGLNVSLRLLADTPV